MVWEEYNKWYRWHLQREIQDFVTFIIHELAIDYKSRVLEIGAGPGWVSLELARRMPDIEIVGVEQTAELVDIANQNKIQQNIPNIDFIHDSIDHLNIFSNRSYDSIISFKSLRRWKTPQQTLNEIKRILKSGGSYAIIDNRKDLKWLAKASIWFTDRTMAKQFRSYWKETIHCRYSLEEIIKMLMQTKLKDWKIRTTLFDLLIYNRQGAQAGTKK